MRELIFNKRLLLFLICITSLIVVLVNGAMSDSAAVEQGFRQRLDQVANAESTAEDVKAEILFGRQLAARILGRYQLYKDDKLTRYINLVGKGVAQYSNRPELVFRFAVLDTEIVNAFAAPGGYIFVTKGALKAMDNESELAAVLAHEIAHVAERHIVKELKIKGSDDSSTAGMARVIGGKFDAVRVVFTQMVDNAVELLMEKGLKKQDEFDADRIGTFTIAGAGYDPKALYVYLKKISTPDKDTNIITGTHPSFEDRLSKLELELKENNLTDKIQPVVKERFNENIKIK